MTTEILNTEPQVATKESPFGTISETVDLDEAMSLSGLDFLVESIKIRPEGEDELIEGFCAIRHAESKLVFNIPTTSYEITQNKEVMDFAMPLITAASGSFTRMGFFKGGASIFAFATLPEKLVISEDVQLSQHIVIQSSHDGSAAVSIRFLATGNTDFNGDLLLHSASVKHKIDYRHTRNVKLRMEEISRLISIKTNLFNRMLEDSKSLLGSTMSEEEVESFLNHFFDIDPTDLNVVVSASKQQAKDEIVKLYNSIGRGAENTKLGMLLAVALHRSTQARTRKVGNTTEAEARFHSSLNGSGASDIVSAWSMLMQGVTK